MSKLKKLNRMDVLLMFRIVENRVRAGKLRLTENEDEVAYSHTPEEIAKAVYRVADGIYYKNKFRFDRSYEIDDFRNDAYMHIQNLFDTGYIKPDRENIDGIIYSLLSGFFVKNIGTAQKNAANTFSWDNNEIEALTKGNSRLSFDPKNKKLYGAMPDQGSEDPSEITARKELEEEGKMIVDAIIDLMSFQPYATRKYTYIGELNGEPLALSEANLAKLYFNAYTISAVLELFGYGTERNSETSYITHQYRKVREKINDALVKLSDAERAAVAAYVDTIEVKKASYES